MGGKQRIAGKLSSAMLIACAERGSYCEPFIGGGSVFARMVPYFKQAVGSDIHPDLMLLWEALYGGWQPPDTLSESKWRELRDAPPSPLRAFAGFGCSFGGRFFEGYARSGYNDAAAARRGLLAKLAGIASCENVSFTCQSYLSVSPLPGAVIYCDPPYRQANVKMYRGRHTPAKFDHDEFWTRCLGWSADGCHVFVSEYECPVVGECVLEVTRNVEVRARSGGGLSRVERLWYLKPSAAAGEL
jgi:DNA adenine methylase